MTKSRDYAREKTAALTKRVYDLAEIREARDSGTLGDEVLKLAQAMILCTLPYRPTSEAKVTRKARLGDGSMLIVTFIAAREGVPMAFGSDRKLLTWMFDRAIQADSPYVPWRNAIEYNRDVGINDSGKNLRDLRDRFRRISGLVINIERRSAAGEKGKTLPVLEEWNLPASMHSIEMEEQGQKRLTAIDEPYGFRINESLFRDIKKHHIAIPRKLWLRTRGSAQMQDILLWLFYRCYAAQSESVIPWDAVRQQLPQDDSNPWRLKQVLRRAVRELHLIWPEAQVDICEQGVWVNRSFQVLLPDDPLMNRRRRAPLQLQADRTSP